MNFDEAPSYLKAADAHAIASDNTSIFEDMGEMISNAPKFMGVSLASGLNSFWNSGVAVGNIFRDEEDQMEYNDTGEWISSMDEDLGAYYKTVEDAADLTGFIVTSFVPGLGAIKGLNAAQGAMRAAAAGRAGGNFAKATGILAPVMETYVKREAAMLAAQNSAFSFMHANSLKALAAGAGQGILEGLAFETAVAATMFKSPILDDMDAGDLLSNAMLGVGLGGAVGGIASAAQTYFGVGRLLKAADMRAKPFGATSAVFATKQMLPSDEIVMAAQDLKRLEGIQATPEVVLAQKKAMGETGESILPHNVEAEATQLERFRTNAIQETRNKIQTKFREMSGDDVLGNQVADLAQFLGADDVTRFAFQAQKFVRAGQKSPVDKEAAMMVAKGEAKTVAKARKFLAPYDADMYITLHSGKIGEMSTGAPDYLRAADRYSPEELAKHLSKNSFKPKDKLDYRSKDLSPLDLETRWLAARRSEIPFPKGYVFGSHDLPALEKAIRLGLDEVVVDFGDGIRTFKQQELKDHFLVAKTEAVHAQIQNKRRSGMIEAITDVRKDFIEGTMPRKVKPRKGSKAETPATTRPLTTEEAFSATESYMKEYAEFIGKDVGQMKIKDFDLMPRYAKTTYRTSEMLDDEGNIVKGMQIIKEREKLAKAAIENHFANYLGQTAELFPEIPEELLRSAWRGEGGAGLITNAGGAYGSMSAMASMTGNIVAEAKKLKISAVQESITPHAQAILTNPDDAIRLSAIWAQVARTKDLMVLDDTGEYLISLAERKAIEKAAQRGDDVEELMEEARRAGISLPEGAVRGAVHQRIALADQRLSHQQAAHALQGNEHIREPGVFRPVRLDSRDYKHVAFVKDPTIVGANHTQMLIAKDAEDLKRMILEVEKLGHYNVYTKQQAEEFYKARGEWDYDKTLHENYIDHDLKSKGIMSPFFPATDPQKVVNMWLQDEVRAEHTLFMETVLMKYQKEVGELKRMAQTWDETKGSRMGNKSIDEILTSPSDKNPYIGLMKSMLNITKLEEMPIWLRTANEATDAVVSRAWDAASKVLMSTKGHRVDQAHVDHINEIFEEVGFRSSYSIAATELANQNLPRGVLSTFVRTSNAFLTATMLRMDVFNAITNKVGLAILYAPEIKSVLKDIKSGDVSRLGPLAMVKVPGTKGDEIFSPSKLLAGSYKRLHGPNGAALREEYKKRGLLPDLSEQVFKSLDAMTLTGTESIADMTSKTAKVKEGLAKFANTMEKYTGNKWVEESNRLYALDSMKQLTEEAVRQGKMTEAMAWSYVNTFNNRVNGVIRAAERPLMFQGPIGQAMGLFQSYQINLMQQLFRNIGEGRHKQLAMMAGLQGSIFGASSLPGFNLINNSLIANASGNPEHYDIHSATRMIFGDEGADWLMYGIPSNVLNASLFTRGDVNPRSWHVVPNPTNPEEIPFISAFAKAFGSLKQAAGQVAGGAPLWGSFLGGIEHLGLSRPLAGIAAIGRAATSDGMQVISTQRNGNIAGSNDLFSLASLVRVAGAKPLDEAIVTNNYFRINAYREADREKRERLGTELKTAVMNGEEITDDMVNSFAERYAARGGNPTGFGQWWMSQFKNANVPQTQQMVEKLNNPYARRMQEIMGGRESLFDVGSF